MNTKVLLTVAAAIGISAVATTALAAPLPAGTKLAFAPWINPVVPLLDGVGCTYGSCFGMGVFGTFYAWTALDLGTDGGLIIGKGQQSGGQEVDLASTNPGELTAMWDFGGNHGTFFTAPSSTGNVFDDASCAGSGCGSNTTPRKTDLAVWNTAWGAQVIPMGSAAGCNKAVLSNCTADMVAGIFVNSWTIDPPGTTPGMFMLKYDQIVPTAFPNFPFRLLLRGAVMHREPAPLVSINGSAAPANLITTSGTPVSFTIVVIDTDGPAAPTCRAMFTTPANGVVTLNNCTSGTYTSDAGFVGMNSFNIIANDSLQDSFPAAGGIVNVAVQQLPTPLITPSLHPTPTFTPFTFPSPTPTTTPTNPPSPTACTDRYPIKQVTLAGKQGHLSVVVTGNITFANPNGKEIKICPTTTASYSTTTNTPGATVVCQVRSNTSTGQGNIKVNDQVKCSDKPVGNDKVHFKIKSGEYKKAM